MTTTKHTHTWLVIDTDADHVYLWCACEASSQRPNLTGATTEELVKYHSHHIGVMEAQAMLRSGRAFDGLWLGALEH